MASPFESDTTTDVMWTIHPEKNEPTRIGFQYFFFFVHWEQMGQQSMTIDKEQHRLALTNCAVIEKRKPTVAVILNDPAVAVCFSFWHESMDLVADFLFFHSSRDRFRCSTGIPPSNGPNRLYAFIGTIEKKQELNDVLLWLEYLCGEAPKEPSRGRRLLSVHY